MAQPPAFPALQTQQQPFLCVETLKVVVGRAEAALARENHFRLFDAMPSDALKALTTESMRRANYGGGSHEVMVQAAVDGVCDRVRTAHHLVRGSVQADFDRISAERAGIPAAPPPPPPIEEDDDVPSEAELKAAMLRRLAEREGDPAAGAALPPMPPPPPEGLAPPAPLVHVATKMTPRIYNVVISSLDRDWAGNHPLRCRYQAKLLNAPIKNVVSVEVDRVVLPAEIRLSKQDTTTDGLNYRHRTTYDVPTSVLVPFIMVQAEELLGAYAGTSDGICRALACCTHEKSFIDVCGRGYDIFRPAPNSAREYRPPLATLPPLTLSFTRPNHVLLNAGTDGIAVRKFAYSNLRPGLIEVIMLSFFDRNQYYIGDFVAFTAYSGGNGGAVADFLQRPEGHTVVDMGTINVDSYYSSFFIKSVGTFDPVEGEFDPDQTFLDALLADALLVTVQTASIINLSLQNTLFLRVTALEMTNAITMDYELNN